MTANQKAVILIIGLGIVLVVLASYHPKIIIPVGYGPSNMQVQGTDGLINVSGSIKSAGYPPSAELANSTYPPAQALLLTPAPPGVTPATTGSGAQVAVAAPTSNPLAPVPAATQAKAIITTVTSNQGQVTEQSVQGQIVGVKAPTGMYVPPGFTGPSTAVVVSTPSIPAPTPTPTTIAQAAKLRAV